MMREGLAAAVFGLALAASTVAHAADEPPARLRPYDAPDVATPLSPVPSASPEYVIDEVAGFRFVYHPLARERVRPLLGRASEMRNELAARVGRPVLASVEVRIAATPAEMAPLSPVELPTYASTVALARYHLIIMSLGRAPSLEPVDLEEGLRHELAHIALDEAVGDHPLPRWFHEGFAIDFSGEARAARGEALFSASMRDHLVPLAALEGQLASPTPPASLAAAEAADFARYLGASPAPSRVGKLTERVREGDSFESAVAAACSADPAQAEATWRKDVARRYGFLPVLLAGALSWMLIALAVIVRRVRGRTAAAKRTRRIAEREARATFASAARTRPRPHPRLEAFTVDPEVPKIEHDGRWYTLH